MNDNTMPLFPDKEINEPNNEFFSEKWFQVFDYLYRYHNILTPTNSKRFNSFIKKLEKKEPEIFSLLIEHLNKFNVEKLLELIG